MFFKKNNEIENIIEMPVNENFGETSISEKEVEIKEDTNSKK